MTDEQQKSKAITAWKKQLDKYAKGPVIGESYCRCEGNYLCDEFCIFDEGILMSCSFCPLSLVDSGTMRCCRFKTQIILRRYVVNNDLCGYLNEITTGSISIMELRHKFYVQGLAILESLPPERFGSEFLGFNELVKLDSRLIEEKS